MSSVIYYLHERATDVNDTAYYFPAPYWSYLEQGWVKSLLLFFDDVAILLPRYMYGQHTSADPELTGPLEERGLLQVLRPSDWIDDDMAHELATAMVDALTNGAFDDLEPAQHYQELSMSRMGYSADVELAEFLVTELRERDLARPSQDGVSVPLHPIVRHAILVLLAQMSRKAGAKRGMTVHPTSSPQFGDRMVETLSGDPVAGRAEVFKSDLTQVAVNLESIPLDDVIQFRREHCDAYQTYRRDLLGFVADWSNALDGPERTAMLAERAEKISDASNNLQRTTKHAFGRLPSWSLGLVGGVWSVAQMDLAGTLISAIGTVLGVARERHAKRTASVYSYLVEAQREFR